VVWQANSRRLAAENFDKENVNKLIKLKFVKLVNIFPHQNFVPYGIL